MEYKCPHGEHELQTQSYAMANADAYDQSCKVVTLCCNKPVLIRPVRSYRISKYEGDATQDDWGTPITK